MAEAQVETTPEASSEAKWYVAHTYSGYENKVKVDIEKTIVSRKLQDLILEVTVPMQDVVEVKADGKKVTSQKKLYPGYIFVHMVYTEDTWYIIRNTRGVTGFVGPGSKPVPLSEMDIQNLGIKTENVHIDFEEGDLVTIINGGFKDTKGVVKAVNQSKRSVTISVDMFGRETPVELSFTEVRKVQ